MIQANTGSIAKIRAVRVGLVQRCAQVWMEESERGGKETGDGQRADQRKGPLDANRLGPPERGRAHRGSGRDLRHGEHAHIHLAGEAPRRQDVKRKCDGASRHQKIAPADLEPAAGIVIRAMPRNAVATPKTSMNAALCGKRCC